MVDPTLSDCDLPSSTQYDRLDRLAEEFAARYRGGERPSLEEYTDRYPELAGEIRALFPALVRMERADEDLREEVEGSGASRMAAPPRRLGDFAILGEIGRGGMGVVYEAEQVSLGRRVALKVLARSTPGDATAPERFRREARAAARLHHTNIVPVFEVGHEEDVVYYAMQFIRGQGLDQVIGELRRLRDRPGDDGGSDTIASSGGPRSLAASPSLGGPRVNQLARSLLTGQFDPGGAGPAEIGPDPAPAPARRGTIATAFDPPATVKPRAVHADAVATGPRPAGSIGRDSSASPPGASLLSSVDSGRRPYSLGVARIGQQVAEALAYAHDRGIVHRDIKPSNLLLDTAGVVWVTDFGLAKGDEEALTHTGDVVGTIRYMAPERFRGEGDARADIYALGLTLYELLVLQPAFGSADRLQLIETIKSEEPPRPRSIDPRIPRDLETIVLKAIEKEPGRRYPTAAGMVDDLRCFLDGRPVGARPVGAAERAWRWCRRNPMVAALGTTLVVALGASAVTFAALYVRAERALAGESEARRGTRRALDEVASRVVEDLMARQGPDLDSSQKAFLNRMLGYYESSRPMPAAARTSAPARPTPISASASSISNWASPHPPSRHFAAPSPSTASWPPISRASPRISSIRPSVGSGSGISSRRSASRRRPRRLTTRPSVPDDGWSRPIRT